MRIMNLYSFVYSILLIFKLLFWHIKHGLLVETLPKAQRTRGLSSSCLSQIARNLNKTSASPLNLKFKILTQPSFRISTKIQLHNLNKTSATKCWTSSSFKILLNFNFIILTNPCAQSLKKSLVLGPNVSSQICNETVANMILTINISNSNNLNKLINQVLSWHLHTPGSHQSSLLNRS